MADRVKSDKLILFFCAVPDDVVKCWGQNAADSHRILFFAHGGMEITVNGEEFAVGDRTIVFLRSSDSCEFAPERRGGAAKQHIECYAAFIGNAHYDSVKRLLNETAAFDAYEASHLPPLFTLDDIQCDKMIREMKDFNQSDDVSAADHLNATRLLVVRMYYSFIVKGNKPAARFTDAPGWFNDYYELLGKAEVFTLPFEEIVALSGKTREHLSRVFKQQTGVNISDFIISKRINHACALLRDENATIPEIIRKCGFTNIGTFYSNFKKKTGESPERYRKTLVTMDSFGGRKKRVYGE